LSHVKTQLREVIAPALVAGVGAIDGRLFTTSHDPRFEKLEVATDFPVAILTLSRTRTSAVGSGQGGPLRQERYVDGEVAIIAKSAVGVEETLEEVAVDVEAVLATWANWPIKIQGLSITGDEERLYGKLAGLAVKFTITLSTREGVADTSI
jgi:hypothetical protein